MTSEMIIDEGVTARYPRKMRSVIPAQTRSVIPALAAGMTEDGADMTKA